MSRHHDDDDDDDDNDGIALPIPFSLSSDPLSTLQPSNITTQNIVASCRINTTTRGICGNLPELALLIGGSNTGNFPAVHIRVNTETNNNTTVTIFETGKIITTGSKNLYEIVAALYQVVDALVTFRKPTDLDDIPVPSDFKILNTVSSFELTGYSLDIDRLSKENPLSTALEKNIFSGLRFKNTFGLNHKHVLPNEELEPSNVSAIGFESGHFVLAGPTNHETTLKFCQRLTKSVTPYLVKKTKSNHPHEHKAKRKGFTPYHVTQRRQRLQQHDKFDQ